MSFQAKQSHFHIISIGQYITVKYMLYRVPVCHISLHVHIKVKKNENSSHCEIGTPVSRVSVLSRTKRSHDQMSPVLPK